MCKKTVKYKKVEQVHQHQKSHKNRKYPSKMQNPVKDKKLDKNHHAFYKACPVLGFKWQCKIKKMVSGCCNSIITL